MAIPDITKALERTVFETLRLILVNEGYLPNITNFDVENPDLTIARTAQNNYNAAIENIKNSNKGFAIELFNYSTSQQRGVLKPPRIVIESEGFYSGELGFDTMPRYIKQQDGSFVTVQSIDETSDFFFNVRLIANTTEQLRVLHGVRSLALPRRAYLKWYNQNFNFSGNLFCKYVSFSHQEWKDEGIIEKVYRYMIPDAHEIDDKIIGSTVPINDINLTIKTQ